MRRFFALLLCAAMLLSMGACRRDIPPAPTEPGDPTVATEPAGPAPRELVEAMGAEAGYENAFAELAQISAIASGQLHYTRFQQHYQGLPVYGRHVVCVTDADGDVLTVTGNVEDIAGELSLAPDVDQATAEAAIRSYLSDTLDCGNILSLDVEPLSADRLCIFNMADDAQAHLAYTVRAAFDTDAICDCYEFVIDAHTGHVLDYDAPFPSVSGTLEGYEQRYENVEYSENQEGYYLYDATRNIHAGYAKLASGGTSENPYFTVENSDLDDVIWIGSEAPDYHAVDAYVNTQITYDYFSSQLAHRSTDGNGNAAIQLYLYADHFGAENQDMTGNACGSSMPEHNFSFIVFGYTRAGEAPLSSMLDVVAHEYTHCITDMTSELMGNGEPGAIGEALGDIFGTLTEAWHRKTAPDWRMSVGRSNADPASADNPAYYLGDHFKSVTDPHDKGNVHNNSTVISHAAYLMHKNGLTTEKLERIWYHAMLMMPPDCSFLECRELVELAAQNLNYSQEDQKIIRDAFVAVGIVTPDIPNIEIGPQATLNVLDYYGSIYDCYSLRFWRISNQIHGPLVTLYPTKCVPSESEDVETLTPYTVPYTEGVYLLEITDKFNTNVKELVFLSITDQGPDHVDIPTAFGIVSLDDLMPILEAFESCYAMYYGVQMDTGTAYRRVFASYEDSYEGDFISLAPWDSISWSDSRDELELPVYKVTNFHSLEEVDLHLLQYFTPEFVEEHMRMMMEYRLAMYENQLYWVGHNMGDPPPMDFPNAELEATSSRACTVSVKSGYAGYMDERHTFHFEKTADGWRMTRWETEYL